MSYLHSKLSQSLAWYRHWHQSKKSTYFHWGVFVLVGLVFTNIIYLQIQKVDLTSLSVDFERSHAAGHLQYFGWWGAGPNDANVASYSNIVFVNPTADSGGIDRAASFGMKAVVVFPQPPGESTYLSSYMSSSVWTNWRDSVSPHINNVAAIFLADEPHEASWSALVTRFHDAIVQIKTAFPSTPIWINFLPPNDPYYASVGVAPMGMLPDNADWVGFDCYGPWDNCNHQGVTMATVLQQFEAKKQPAQKIMLIPMAFRDPGLPQYGWDIPESQVVTMADQYLQLANNDSAVIGMAPFYFYDGGTRIGAASLSGVLNKYVSIGSTIIAAAPTNSNASQFISQSVVPQTVTAGQNIAVSITMKNTGTATWTTSGQYRLGSQLSTLAPDSFDSQVQRTDVPSSVAPGNNVTFNFNLTAPSTPGTYVLGRQMVQENVAWFGAYTPQVSITVANNPPPPPTNLILACPSPGNTVTASWTAPSGQNAFYFRANPGADNWTWPSSVFDDNLVGTTKSFGSTAGVTYHVWVHTRDSATGAASATVDGNITCQSAPTTPTLNNISINSQAIKPDSSTTYNIVITSSDAGGGSKISHNYVIINYQGPNGGTYRGALNWYYDQNYTGWDAYKNKRLCSGSGGIGAVNPQYNPVYINLISCSSSVSGQTHTTTFVVTFDLTYTTPSNSHISGFVQNTDVRTDGWKDFPGFDLDIHPIAGDFNLDRIVNALDWSYMNSKWFTSDATADISHDGIVNAIDFSAMNANWFKSW